MRNRLCVRLNVDVAKGQGRAKKTKEEIKKIEKKTEKGRRLDNYA